MIGILLGVILICIGALLERLKWPTFPAFLVGVLLGPGIASALGLCS